MKNIFFLITILSLGFLSSCDNQGKTTDASLIENESTASDPHAKGKGAIMTFEEETFDFGKLTEGEVVEHTYNFTNTGSKALLISAVDASCGCTVPVWPREPIKPGQKSSIKIQFNSANKSENVTKDVTITSNADPVTKKLTFTAYVNKKVEEK